MKLVNDFVILRRKQIAKETRSIKKNQTISTSSSAVAVFHTHPC